MILGGNGTTGAASSMMTGAGWPVATLVLNKIGNGDYRRS
jgi:hypothetical protein